MSFIRAQVTLPRDTNIPADISQNVWHFRTTDPVNETSLDSIHAALSAWYQAIDGLLAGVVNSPATVKYYDLEDASPRVPIDEQTFVVTPASGSGLPSEMAICMSFRAAPESGQSAARRRGRIFIGPVDIAVMSQVGGEQFVGSTPRTTIANAALTLRNAGPTDGWFWSVFSPTTAGSPPWSAGALGSAFADVDNGWVDNALDVQRRRGPAATARTTFG